MDIKNPTWDQIIELVSQLPDLDPEIKSTLPLFVQLAQIYKVPLPWRASSGDVLGTGNKVHLFFAHDVYMAIRPSIFYVGQLVTKPRLDVVIEKTGTWHDVIVELKRLIGHADDYTLDGAPVATTLSLASLLRKPQS